jgi:hypothetical protein
LAGAPPFYFSGFEHFADLAQEQHPWDGATFQAVTTAQPPPNQIIGS